jgi:serine protease Do
MKLIILFICCFLFSINASALSSYADIVEITMPSVVNISTEKVVVEDNENLNNVMINPELDSREALGSGFFIRDDGHILTNAHVINGAKKIKVITNDDKIYEASIIGIDKSSDLAVLKISPSNTDEKFKPAIFGNADKARIGDIVLTMGNPYGLGVSVSQGIISAKSRSIGLSEQQYIQTDAAINQGNSGGPMFNIDGEVIGVNSAIFKTTGATGVGFSLPSNIANWISTQLIKNGKVKRGWTGFSVGYGSDKYTGKDGFVVTEINEASNAYKEGLRVGDIITAYNDIPSTNLSNFMSFVEQMDIDQALRLKTTSFGEEIRHIIRIQEMPIDELKNVTNKALQESNKLVEANADDDIFYISELGISVREANPKGLLIVKIDRFSPLKEKGITKGDVILEVDQSDLYSVDNLLDNIRNAIVDEYRPLSMLIQSSNGTFYATIEMVVEND